MIIAPADFEILRSDEVMDMCRAYEKKFGERFISFNYRNFWTAEEYRDLLRKALRCNEPTRIKSREAEIDPELGPLI